MTAPSTESYRNANEYYAHFTKQRLKTYDQQFIILFDSHAISEVIQARSECVSHIIASGNILQASDDTIFHSIRLFDYFLYQQPTISEPNQPLLIALTSLLIAHKFNDATKLSSFCEHVFEALPIDKTITPQLIVEKEIEFFKILKNDAFASTPLTFLQVYCPPNLNEEVLGTARVLGLISLFSAKISARTAQSIAQAICTLSTLMNQSKDLCEEIFGEKSDPSLVTELRDFAVDFELPPSLIERIDNFDINRFKEQLNQLTL